MPLAELPGQIDDLYALGHGAAALAPGDVRHRRRRTGEELGGAGALETGLLAPSHGMAVAELYPAGTNFRFCQYTATVGGTRPEVTYTTEVITLNPTPAQLVDWMSNACRTAIQLNNRPINRFDQCVRGLFWGLPMSAPEDKKRSPGCAPSREDIRRGGRGRAARQSRRHHLLP